MENTHYHYAIIGAGAAGLNLAIAMAQDAYFIDKKILILDKDEKTGNDRTWSFWEEGKGKYDHILHHSWRYGAFHCQAYSKDLDLMNYRYKMLRSSNFYVYAKEVLGEATNFIWEKEEVLSVKNLQEDGVSIQGESNTFHANHVFDSRVDADFFEEKDDHVRLLQHFKGWFIKTKKPVFDPDKFVMMDFRMQWKNEMSFTYVLPFSETEAMIEFTLFNETMIEDADYNQKIKQYLHEYLKISDYEIVEEEKGVIPMSDFPFSKKNNNNITKIGTAGGWVKPSSGYTFKNCIKFSQKVIVNIKANQVPSHQLISARYRWYDSLMLDILSKRNEIGTDLFATMFKNNKVVDIFQFLDENGTYLSDFFIIKSFEPIPFLKVLGKRVLGI